MDSVTSSMLVVAGVVLPMGGFIWLTAHRQRLQDEAEAVANTAE